MVLPRHRNRGFTVIELVVYIAILGIVLGAALPHIDSRPLSTATAVEAFLGDVRYARSKAIVTGTHVCVHRVSSTRYEVRRLRQSGSSWVLDKVLRSVTMPPNTSFSIETAAESHLKFNTRGMQVAYANQSTAYPLLAKFWDAKSEHGVRVWPSGQAYEEY